MTRSLTSNNGFGRLFAGLALSLGAALASPAVAQDTFTRAQPEAATQLGAKTLVRAKKHLVVAAHPLASAAGREMLRKGGSAVDAAIAAQMVLNLVEPQSSGIGGGAFLLHWDAKAKNLATYDGRETAPATAKPDRFLTANGATMGRRAAVLSGRSVGVPGLLRMLALAHGKHGRLPWRDLFAPAIGLAEEGFPVGRRLHGLLSRSSPRRFGPVARRYFFDADGRPRPVGHRLRNPDFAATLKAVAEQGADAFYTGELAADIVARVGGAPSSLKDMTLGDLKGYAPKVRAPVCRTYRRYKLCGMGPPSSGALTVGMVLKLLEPFDLGAEPLNADAVHLIAEAQKLAYADRGRYMADDDFVPVPKGLLDDAYLAGRRKLIDRQKAMPRAAPGRPPGVRQGAFGRDNTAENVGTSHLSIVDADGNAAAMTTTIEAGFGSGLMVRGFLLNNELTDFAFRPRDRDGRPVANRVEGGKRPRSSMAPTLVFDADGRLRMVAGSPGGTPIILYVLKALIAHLDWGLDAQAAASLTNFGSRYGPFEIEPGPAARRLAPALRARGHTFRTGPMTSGTHIIVVRPDGLEGGADPRREGVALGD
ncbi:MAG: gamma-glutamyltransferase [Methyloligellaceae bacterium]